MNTSKKGQEKKTTAQPKKVPSSDEDSSEDEAPALPKTTAKKIEQLPAKLKSKAKEASSSSDSSGDEMVKNKKVFIFLEVI